MIEKDIDSYWSRDSIETQDLIDFYDLDVVPQTLENVFKREGISYF